MANVKGRKADDRRRGNVGRVAVDDPSYDALSNVLDPTGNRVAKSKWKDRRVRTPHGKRPT